MQKPFLGHRLARIGFKFLAFDAAFGFVGAARGYIVVVNLAAVYVLVSEFAASIQIRVKIQIGLWPVELAVGARGHIRVANTAHIQYRIYAHLVYCIENNLYDLGASGNQCSRMTSYILPNTGMSQKLYQKSGIRYNNYNSTVYDECYDSMSIIRNVISKPLLCTYKELSFAHTRIYLQK